MNKIRIIKKYFNIVNTIDGIFVMIIGLIPVFISIITTLFLCLSIIVSLMSLIVDSNVIKNILFGFTQLLPFLVFIGMGLYILSFSLCLYSSYKSGKYFEYITQKYPILIDFFYHYKSFLPNQFLKSSYQLDELILEKINKLIKIAQLSENKGIALTDCQNDWFNDLQLIIGKLKIMKPNLILGNKEYYISSEFKDKFETDISNIHNLIKNQPNIILPNMVNLNIKDYKSLLFKIKNETV